MQLLRIVALRGILAAEVRIGDKSLMFTFLFSLLPGVKLNEAENGDVWTSIGESPPSFLNQTQCLLLQR